MLNFLIKASRPITIKLIGDHLCEGVSLIESAQSRGEMDMLQADVATLIVFAISVLALCVIGMVNADTR